MKITVEIEAKAKELAIAKLMSEIKNFPDDGKTKF
jgi:hypothetical protein